MYWVKMEETTDITVKEIYGFVERIVTKFGSWTKVDCPKKFLGRKVCLIITKTRNSVSHSRKSQHFYR